MGKFTAYQQNSRKQVRLLTVFSIMIDQQPANAPSLHCVVGGRCACMHGTHNTALVRICTYSQIGHACLVILYITIQRITHQAHR